MSHQMQSSVSDVLRFLIISGRIAALPKARVRQSRSVREWSERDMSRDIFHMLVETW